MEKLVYVVEDEENIRELICATLKSGGFAVGAFERSEELFAAMAEILPNLILLDIMLPGKSGHDILRELKESDKWGHLPVLFLTAKGQEIDKVTGLELGADDYIVKPFGVLELLARVKAVLRRSGSSTAQAGTLEDEVFPYRDLTVDTLQKCIIKDGKQLSLTFKEYELFLHLYKNRGIVLSRDALLGAVWNYSYEGETRTVDSHIRSLRQKIGDAKGGGTYIVTTRGYGYMMPKEEPVEL